jgi:hypothetical protein
VLSSALRHACITMGARGAALAVAWGDEPWIDLLVEQDGALTSERTGPGVLSDAVSAAAHPTLFDLRRGRRIGMAGDHQLAVARGPLPCRWRRRCGVNEGILATFNSVSSQGQLLVWGIPSMAVDDLPWMSALVREIGLALDREEMATLAKSSAVAEVRNALARDLHDSVVQFLAGTMFRLEALRRRLRDGKDPEGEIEAMKDALRREQAQLRVMIDRLRRGEDGDRSSDITEELCSLVEEMAAHWRIRVTFSAHSDRSSSDPPSLRIATNGAGSGCQRRPTWPVQRSDHLSRPRRHHADRHDRRQRHRLPRRGTIAPAALDYRACRSPGRTGAYCRTFRQPTAPGRSPRHRGSHAHPCMTGLKA